MSAHETGDHDRHPAPRATTPSPPARSTAAAGPSWAGALAQLQRSAGNAAVRSLLAGGGMPPAPAPTAVQRTAGEATEAVLTHIFEGELKDETRNKQQRLTGGSVKGYHSENEAASAIAAVPNGAARVSGYGGVYHAKPIVSKENPAVTKPDGSSFFPRSWDRAVVKEAIERSKVHPDPAANRIVTGPLPGLDEKQSIYLKASGDTIYPVRRPRTRNTKA